MFREKIPAKQASAWIVAAVTPPLIQLTAGMPWQYIALTAVICTPVVYVVWRWGQACESRLIRILHGLFLSVLAGILAKNAALSWPVGSHETAVPLILLGLAAWAALKGPAAAARVGCVMFWAVLIMYLVVFGVGVSQIDIRWLHSPDGELDWLSWVLLLTPAAAGVLVNRGNQFRWRMLLMPVFWWTATVICTGILSPNLIGQMDDPFYEMTRSLNILGVARRFEVIISAAMTVGWFSLLSLYLTICGTLAEKARAGWGRAGTLAGAGIAAVVVLCDLHIAPPIMATGAAVFWVAIPLITQGIGRIKKSKKSEKLS